MALRMNFRPRTNIGLHPSRQPTYLANHPRNPTQILRIGLSLNLRMNLHLSRTLPASMMIGIASDQGPDLSFDLND